MPVNLGNEAVGTIAGDPEGAIPAFATRPDRDIVTTLGMDTAASGYCLWEFDGAAWIVKKDRCKAGYVPSAPPSVPGRFRGQLRAVMSVPASAIVGERAMIVSATEE
ncbi:MAG: hypothetical protein ACLQGP_41895 [Isosphaeraceae bacterium]